MSRTKEVCHPRELMILIPTAVLAMLPYSFRLSRQGHIFDLATACQQEKVAWLSSIRESLAHSSDHWVNEPISSLRVEGKGELVSSNLDGPFEAVNALPTIQSISDMAESCTSRAEDTSATVRPRLQSAKSDGGTLSTSRRSSTASVKSIFMPLTAMDNDTILIRKSSASSRAYVDLGLQDVISEPCVAARSLATSREQELFSASTIARPATLSRTATNLSRAKSRLMRHDSVRVPRRNILDTGDDIQTSPTKSVFRAQNSTQRKRKRFSINSANSEAESLIFPPSTGRLSPSSGPSLPGSEPSSGQNSANSSPVHEGPDILGTITSSTFVPSAFPAPAPLRPTASSSLVGNMREFFVGGSQRTGPAVTISDPASTKGKFKKWISSKSVRQKPFASASDIESRLEDTNKTLALEGCDDQIVGTPTN
jgi:hypothetical protein